MLRRLLFLALLALSAACAGGQPPLPATSAAVTAALSATPPPATPGSLTPTAPPAQATPLPATATLAPTLAVTEPLTAGAALITPINALSLTQVALLETGPADQVAWSPDGARLAVAGAGGVVVYDAATLTATQPITVGQWATSLAFDPRGEFLAVGTVGAIVQVWSLPRQAPASLLLGPGVQVARLAYHPRGGVLASLGVDNRAHLWDVDAQQYLGGLGAGLRPAHVLAFSADARWLATAEGERVLLWDVDDALADGSPTAHSLLAPASRRGAVTAVAFNPASDQLAAANTSGTIELWYPDGTRPARSLARLSAPALALAYSPDGLLLASAHQDRALRLWDPATGALLTSLPGHTDLPTSLAFSPDGARLASSSRDGTVRLWGLVDATTPTGDGR
jgi:WD40 repeat protein